MLLFAKREFFNCCIEGWANKGIAFSGIIHTHFAGIKTLSQGDLLYIEKIMKAIPEGVNKIYFPILVLPEMEIVSYYAVKDRNIIVMAEDTEYC